MIKELNHQKGTSALNVYLSINGFSKEMKQTLASILTLSVINRTTRQKINKDIGDLNNTINQFYLIHYGTLYPTPEEGTFSLSAHGMLTEIDRPCTGL